MKLACLLSSALILASTVASGGQILHSFAEINAFFEDATPRNANFELTGKVLSTCPLSETGEIILANDSGERLQFFRYLHLSQPKPGDTITAVGLASVSKNHEPYISIDDFKVIEHGVAPEPVTVRLSETHAQKHHLALIRTEGVVIDAFPDDVDRRYMILLLKDKDVIVPLPILLDSFGDRSDLVDATIRVTGIYRRTVSGVRKFAWPNITPRNSSDIEVVTPPPKDPFSAPPIEKRLYLTSEEIAQMSRRSVVGEVLATWSRDLAMLRTDDGQIVNIKLVHGTPLPPCGETIVAAGLPETDLFRINLTSARWKVAADAPRKKTEEKAESVINALWYDDRRGSLRAEAYGKLLAVRGIVRTIPSPDDSDDLRFTLDAGGISFAVDVTSNREIIDTLQIGCTVQVTGRYILLADAGRRDFSSAKVKGLAIVVRSPADVVVLSRPSWWTLQRLTIVISILLAALIAVYIWNRALQRLASRRGRELYREQVAHAIAEFKTDERTRLAVELHDSLSQALSGVACHMTVGAAAFDSDPATARRYLATARKMLNSCRTELRQCLFDLRSDTLEEQDFSTAIRRTLDQLESDATVLIRFNVPRQRLKDTTAHAILAIVRELTGNAIRHGKATEVRIAGCIEPERLVFSVRDNGSGFDPSNCDGPIQGHFGIEGIRNRLEKLDGTLVINSTPGAGAKATVSIPLPSAQRQEKRES